MRPNLSQLRGRAMSSSIARSLEPLEREELRRELLADPGAWTARARDAADAGQREWEAALGLLETAYCGRCGRRIAPLPGDAGDYRCPACGADLWRSASSEPADHLHDEPGVGCSVLRCDQLHLRPTCTAATE